jgi:hypothetical protein
MTEKSIVEIAIGLALADQTGTLEARVAASYKYISLMLHAHSADADRVRSTIEELDARADDLARAVLTIDKGGVDEPAQATIAREDVGESTTATPAEPPRQDTPGNFDDLTGDAPEAVKEEVIGEAAVDG